MDIVYKERSSLLRGVTGYDKRPARRLHAQLDRRVEIIVEEKKEEKPVKTGSPNPWDKNKNPKQWANIQRILDIMNGVTSH